MTNRQIVRSELRSATARCHERVDSLFSRADLADRAGYGRFLTAQADAHLPAEAALTAAGAATVLADWPARRRGDLLCADLEVLALPIPAGGERPTFTAAAAVLGGIYVLEGSRLGGRVLRKAVPSPLPTRFLDAAGPGGWRRLLGILEERLAAPADLDAAIAAAIAVFALFERSAERHLARPL